MSPLIPDLPKFAPGDRVRGVASGDTYTVQAVREWVDSDHNGDYTQKVTAIKDGATGAAELPNHRFELVTAAPRVADTFAVGDTVRRSTDSEGKVYEVVGVANDGKYLWLQEQGYIRSWPGTTEATGYVKVGPFFEADKEFASHKEWSITFQRRSMTEVFQVKRVDTDWRGFRVAYGRLYLPGVPDVGDRWTTLTEYDFKSEKWKRLEN